MSSAPEAIKSTKVPKKVWAIVIAIIVVLSAVIAALVYAGTASGPPPRIVSVSHSPATPRPGDVVTVEVIAEGGSFADPLDIGLNYASYFAGGESGGGGTGGYGVNRGTWQIGPFSNGTEVWFVATASTQRLGIVMSEGYTLQIGEVLRGGPSNLHFGQVVRTPAVVTTLDDPVVIAQVTSLANITNVQLVTFAFVRGGGAGGGGFVLKTGPDTYTGYLVPGGPGGGLARGTVVLYRLAAIDGTNNTAVTETFTFTVK